MPSITTPFIYPGTPTHYALPHSHSPHIPTLPATPGYINVSCLQPRAWQTAVLNRRVPYRFAFHTSAWTFLRSRVFAVILRHLARSVPTARSCRRTFAGSRRTAQPWRVWLPLAHTFCRSFRPVPVPSTPPPPPRPLILAPPALLPPCPHYLPTNARVPTVNAAFGVTSAAVVHSGRGLLTVHTWRTEAGISAHSYLPPPWLPGYPHRLPPHGPHYQYRYYFAIYPHTAVARNKGCIPFAFR